jgi:hypothetical protein
MATEIHPVDKRAMNRLFQSELIRTGLKTAADDGKDPQAFEDHKEYEATVEAILREDKTESWDPNDPLLD